MELTSRLTSKGQVTVPKAAREALGIVEGDSLLFKVTDGHLSVSKTPDFISMAGSVKAPKSRKGASWQEVLKFTHDSRASKRN